MSLSDRGLAALFWGAAGSALRMALQVASQVVLARVLGPAEYGVFATCQIVIALSVFLADVGLAYGLIQKADVTDADVRFVVAWQWILGLVVAGGIVLGRDAIAGWFAEPRAAPVLALLAGVCLVNALAAPSLNLLKRDLDFKRVQMASVVSYFVGFFVVAIPLALAGAGVWALAAGWGVQSVLMLALLYAAVRHPLRPLLWYSEAAVQWRYAASVLGTNVVNWLGTNVDRVVVARAFGAHDVGLYNTSFNLVYAPGAAVAGVLQPALFSAAARTASRPDALAAAYRQATALALLLVGVPFGIVAVLAEPVVAVVLGPRWTGAVELVVPLALAMPMLAWAAVSTPMLWMRDRTSRELRVQLPLLLLTAVGTIVAAAHSLRAVAWTAAALCIARGVVLGAYAWRACRLKPADAGAVLLPVALWLGLVLAATALAAALAAQAPLWLRLACGLAAAAVAFVAVPRVVAPVREASDLRAGLTRLCARFPALARLLGNIASHDSQP